MAKHVMTQSPQSNTFSGTSYTLSTNLSFSPKKSNMQTKTMNQYIGRDLIKTLLVTSFLLAGQIILYGLLTRHIIHVNNVHF